MYYNNKNYKLKYYEASTGEIQYCRVEKLQDQHELVLVIYRYHPLEGIVGWQMLTVVMEDSKNLPKDCCHIDNRLEEFVAQTGLGHKIRTGEWHTDKLFPVYQINLNLVER